MADIAAETDSTFICVGITKVFRFFEAQYNGSYTTLFDAPAGTTFRSVACPRLGSVIYAAGLRGVVYKSINRGRTFVRASTGIAPSAKIVEISFPSADTGYAATNLGVYATYDSARSWQLLPGTASAKEVSFQRGSFGFYLSDTGSYPVYLTYNAGQTWQQQPLRSSASLKLVSLSTTKEGHCYVLARTPVQAGVNRRDSLYMFRNAHPSILTQTRPVASVATLRVWPNPSQGILTLEGIAPDEPWRLLSVTGEAVAHGTGPGTVHLVHTPQAMYLLEVGVGSLNRRTQRVLLQ